MAHGTGIENVLSGLLSALIMNIVILYRVPYMIKLQFLTLLPGKSIKPCPDFMVPHLQTMDTRGLQRMTGMMDIIIMVALQEPALLFMTLS